MSGNTDAMYHPIEWTPERIERFWNFYGANAAAHGSYFSGQFGRAIVALARHHAELSGTLVDLGCGPGDLVGELLRHGFPCRAMDSSPVAVGRVRERFARHPDFLGGVVGSLDRIPLQDGEAGAVFLIEVLEHLPPEVAAKALAECRRVLQPGGHLIVTVPNEENLAANAVACPDCGCVFHRMQHVRRFSQRSLAEEMQRADLDVPFVAALHLKYFGGNWATRPVGSVRHWARELRRRANPHLFAIGRRPST